MKKTKLRILLIKILTRNNSYFREGTVVCFLVTNNFHLDVHGFVNRGPIRTKKNMYIFFKFKVVITQESVKTVCK